MNELQINKYLKESLKDYFFLKRLGVIFPKANKVADQLLISASKRADLILDRTSYTKFSCPRCGRIITDREHQAFVKQVGCCVSCDHLYSDNPYAEV